MSDTVKLLAEEFGDADKALMCVDQFRNAASALLSLAGRPDVLMSGDASAAYLRLREQLVYEIVEEAIPIVGYLIENPPA